MAPYLRVVDGEVDWVGPLPAVARRLDTGHRVDPRTRMKACGYYDVETVTVTDLPPGLTAAQTKAIMTTAAEACDRHDRKIDFVTDLRPDLETGRDYDWAWLQNYSSVQFEGLQPGAGAKWNQTTPAARTEVLRTAISWLMWQQVKLADFADMAGRLLRPIFNDTNLEPPPIPTPPLPTVLPAGDAPSTQGATKMSDVPPGVVEPPDPDDDVVFGDDDDDDEVDDEDDDDTAET